MKRAGAVLYRLLPGTGARLETQRAILRGSDDLLSLLEVAMPLLRGGHRGALRFERALDRGVAEQLSRERRCLGWRCGGGALTVAVQRIGDRSTALEVVTSFHAADRGAVEH